MKRRRLSSFGLSLAQAGDYVGARAIYDEMRSRAVREYMPPMCFAVLAAALGENDAAIACAREAMRRDDPQLFVYSAAVPGREPFRALPEVRALFAETRQPGWPKERTCKYEPRTSISPRRQGRMPRGRAPCR